MTPYQRHQTKPVVFFMSKKFIITCFFLSILFLCTDTYAQKNDAFENFKKNGGKVTNITPVFSQLVLFSFPAGFLHAFENTTDRFYISEAVLKGETVKQWSQMITLTGGMGLAPHPKLSPKLYAAQMASRFKSACPNTFAAKGIGALTVSGHNAFIAWMGCGAIYKDGRVYSESSLVIAIKGSDDYYTIQWAERSDESSQSLAFDGTKWTTRLAELPPIKLCPRTPGEASPYPSCVNQP